MASVYPGGLDSLSTAHVDGVNEPVHAATVNDLADAVNKVEAELGIDPSGSYSTVAARLNGGSLPSVKYRLVSDGTTVTAYDHTGAPVSSGVDGGAVLTACLPAAASVGATIDFRNDGQVFPWGSVPALPKGITSKLLIRGNGALVRLSSGGPRFLDFNRTADYDTFQNIEVDGFQIDCNSVAGGFSHVILGLRTPAGATADQRVNYTQITVRNVRAYNIPVVSNERVGISLACHHLASNETQTSATGILFENVRVEGGCGGFLIAATTSPYDATATVNHFIDDIRIINCYHSCLAPQAGGGVFYGVQIAQNAYGNKVTIRDFRSFYSGDVGIEIDNMTSALCDGCHVENPTQQGYFSTNFRAPDKANSQRWTYRNCVVRVTDATYGPPKGFGLKSNNSIAIGAVTIRDCAIHRETAATNQGDAIDCESPLTIRSLHVDGLHVNIEGISAASGSVTPIMLTGMVVTDRITFRRMTIRTRGTKTGAGTLVHEGIRFGGSGATGFTGTVDCDGLDCDMLITGYGGGAFNTNLVQMGIGGISAIRGTWKGITIINLGDDTGAQGFNFGSAANLVISNNSLPDFITIKDSDFRNLPQTLREVRFLSPPDNQQCVRMKNIRWRTYPKVSLAMGTSTNVGGFAAATFTSATGNQYVGLAEAEIHFATGTGAGITKIESSKDGVTYEQVYAQASGAMAQDVLVHVDNGDYIKVTFATTQPTTRVRVKQ